MLYIYSLSNGRGAEGPISFIIENDFRLEMRLMTWGPLLAETYSVFNIFTDPYSTV